MNKSTWNVTFMVHRQKGQEVAHFDRFALEVDPDEYVLDGIERIWAFHDRSLTFRHACHHSTCGACGMRVNSVEKLTCITRIRDVTHDGGTITIEPLRNFSVVSDLVVDMSPFYAAMERTGFRQVVPVGAAPESGSKGIAPAHSGENGELLVVVGGLYRGLNGLRVALTSFGVGVAHQKLLFCAVLAVVVVGGAIFAVRMLG